MTKTTATATTVHPMMLPNIAPTGEFLILLVDSADGLSLVPCVFDSVVVELDSQKRGAKYSGLACPFLFSVHMTLCMCTVH